MKRSLVDSSALASSSLCCYCFEEASLKEQEHALIPTNNGSRGTPYITKEEKDYFCDSECQSLYYNQYVNDSVFEKTRIRVHITLLTRTHIKKLLYLHVLTIGISDVAHIIMFYMCHEEMIHITKGGGTTKHLISYNNTTHRDFTIFRNHYGIFVSGRCGQLRYLLNGQLSLNLSISEPFKLFKPLEYWDSQFLEQHSFHLSADKGLFVCGENNKYQLGMENVCLLETKLTTIGDKSPFKYVNPKCGSNHTMWLIDGKIYGVGDNSRGQLGVSSITIIQNPTLITHNYYDEPIGYVTQLECCLDYTIIRTQDGKVYGTGSNGFGQLGLGDCLNRRRFTQITSLVCSTNVVRVTDVKCVHNRTFFTLYHTNLKCYYVTACGSNNYGCLGILRSELIINEPVRLPSPYGTNEPFFESCDKPIIINSHNHSTVIVSTKRFDSYYPSQRKYQLLLACGKNNSYQLGLDDNQHRNILWLVPVGYGGKPLHETPRNYVKHVELGENQMIILFQNGYIKGCGANDKGQLGCDKERTMLTRLEVLDVVHQKTGCSLSVRSVTSSFDSTIIQTTNHLTFATGYNKQGQLGLGDYENRYSFTLVQFPNRYPQLGEDVS